MHGESLKLIDTLYLPLFHLLDFIVVFISVGLSAKICSNNLRIHTSWFLFVTALGGTVGLRRNFHTSNHN